VAAVAQAKPRAAKRAARTSGTRPGRPHRDGKALREALGGDRQSRLDCFDQGGHDLRELEVLTEVAVDVETLETNYSHLKPAFGGLRSS
jgi:hypothetical protein